MGSDPPVLSSTSPEDMYQSNTSPTPSLESATKPSSDTDMIATTFDMACSFRERKTAFSDRLGVSVLNPVREPEKRTNIGRQRRADLLFPPLDHHLGGGGGG